MQIPYPTSPTAIPPDLTAASRAYRRHAWIAVLSLFGFVTLYLALLVWLALTAWRLGTTLMEGQASNPLLAAIVAFGAAFLALFMAKALVFIKRGQHQGNVEIRADEQPQLFAFLHRLADEAGAPRPHRVFISAQVNAAVFYDLSIANLLIPSRKNLEIGLGLVNVLNLSELKAVLAHEFGHFAQRTMAVGRWVYIAQQIAAHIIEKRDALDSFLAGLSRVDLRVAWIGWVLRLVVWSIRSLVELLFRGVVLAQLALSREMEYQADLVAASLSGSDALVHALHKLGAADDAFQRAIGFAGDQIDSGQAVRDLFAIQTRIIEQLRAVLADPAFGAAPPLPAEGRESHRVFKNEIGQPPKMWATHPANDDRERNIKARYIPAALDERPAWDVFVDAQSLRERVTATVFQGQLPDPAPIEESLRRVDKGFARQSFDRRYRGSFLGRSIVLHARQVGELYDAVPADIDLRKALATLYGDAHDQDLDRCRQLRQEQSLLEALHAGYLSAPGGLVRWRGSDRPKRDVPELMAQVQAELAPLEDAIRAHDRRCRSLHLGAAEQIGNGWAPYLKGLLATLHYAEHAGADIDDANGVLSNTYRVVLADNQVSANELNRLLSSCNVLQSALGAVYERKSQLHLCPELCARLGIESWSAALGEFNLPMATKDNINSWFNAIHSWLNATRGALANLSSASLELLLETEQRVERAIADGQALTAAPPAPSVPADYPTLVPGQERKRPDKLSLWDRFQLADGWIAGAARFGVAASIVGSVLLLGARTESTYLHVYNGLGVDVVVDIDGVTEKLAAGQSSTLSIPGGQHQVRTQTIEGELIEAFDAESARAAQMVYNIAGAAPLIEWTMVYGNARERPERMLGTQRWVATGADHVFEDPPESITTRGDGGIRTVLSVTSDPTVALARTSDETQRAEMRRQHALWDSADSPDVVIWLRSAQDLPDFPSILDRRLQRNPEDVPARRAQQDAVDGDQKNQVCAEHDAAAKANSASANAAYLAIRCMPDGPEKSAAFLKAHERWPEHPWLHFAAAMVHSGNAEWERAATMLETSLRLLPQMAEPTRNALLRLSRLLGTNAEREKQLANGGAYFAYQLSLETAEGWNASSGAHAFPLLIRGELDAAIERVGSDSEFGNLVRVLVAASDGASEEQIRAGLAVADDQTLSLPVLGSAAALALREGGDASVPLAALRQNHDAADVDQLERFLISLHQGEAPQSAADRLGPIDLELRGAAYAAAAVLLGERCPHDWRQQAKALLLGFERPFLR